MGAEIIDIDRTSVRCSRDDFGVVGPERSAHPGLSGGELGHELGQDAVKIGRGDGWAIRVVREVPGGIVDQPVQGLGQDYEAESRHWSLKSHGPSVSHAFIPVNVPCYSMKGKEELRSHSRPGPPQPPE